MAGKIDREGIARIGNVLLETDAGPAPRQDVGAFEVMRAVVRVNPVGQAARRLDRIEDR